METMELFRRLIVEEGKTAVVVTHDQRVFGFADQILWLEDGQRLRVLCLRSRLPAPPPPHAPPSAHEHTVEVAADRGRVGRLGGDGDGDRQHLPGPRQSV